MFFFLPPLHHFSPLSARCVRVCAQPLCIVCVYTTVHGCVYVFVCSPGVLICAGQRPYREPLCRSLPCSKVALSPPSRASLPLSTSLAPLLPPSAHLFPYFFSIYSANGCLSLFFSPPSPASLTHTFCARRNRFWPRGLRFSKLSSDEADYFVQRLSQVTSVILSVRMPNCAEVGLTDNNVKNPQKDISFHCALFKKAHSCSIIATNQLINTQNVTHFINRYTERHSVLIML